MASPPNRIEEKEAKAFLSTSSSNSRLEQHIDLDYILKLQREQNGRSIERMDLVSKALGSKHGSKGSVVSSPSATGLARLTGKGQKHGATFDEVSVVKAPTPKPPIVSTPPPGKLPRKVIELKHIVAT